MAAGDPAAGHEFVHKWNRRIEYWVAQGTDDEYVEEYTQEVWAHLIEGNWLRLLQWNALFDDEVWHEHSQINNDLDHRVPKDLFPALFRLLS